MMKRLFLSAVILFLSVSAFAQEKIRPGTVTTPRHEAFDCYRSFQKEFEMTRLFADELGISNRCFFASNSVNSLGEYYCEYPPIWVRPGGYEWEHLDAQIDDLIRCSPKARLICMIDLNTPYWSMRKYGMDSYEAVSHFGFNEKWLKETAEWMEAFLSHTEGKYSDRIFAYILSGGSTSEWYDSNRSRGYSSSQKDQAWRKWCKDHQLRYGDGTPTLERINAASFEGVVYDPQKDAEVIDYWKFTSESTVNAILRFALRARKVLPADKQIGVFFGYYFIRGLKEVSFGHSAYEKVFASPDIDFVIAPGSYTNREIGEGTGSQMVFGTAMLHGKRLLHEIDFRPHGYSVRPGNVVWNSTEDDVAGNIREACFSIINHCNLWWFDMWGHFYDEQPVRDAIAQTHRIFERFKDDNSASVSEVLYLADPESNYYFNDSQPTVSGLCNGFRKKMGTLGFPIDAYSFSDVARLDLSQYKVVCIPSMVTITPQKEKMLREYLCKDGRTLVWCYAPGITDGVSLDVARVEKWAGVPYKTEGISTAEMDGWKAVYAWRPDDFTVEAIKDICLKAGVHQYVDGNIPVFANERLLCIHCKEGGVKTVTLPKKAGRVVELMSGKEVARRTRSFKYDFRSPQTALFEILP